MNSTSTVPAQRARRVGATLLAASLSLFGTLTPAHGAGVATAPAPVTGLGHTRAASDLGPATVGDATHVIPAAQGAKAEAKYVGEHKVYILPISISSTEPAPLDELSIRDAVSAANAYYSTASAGELTVSLGDIWDWSRISMSVAEWKACDRKAYWREISKLVDGGGSLDHVIATFDNRYCDVADVEWLGATTEHYGLSFVANLTVTAPVLERAVAHNNWVYGTASLHCVDGSTPVPLSDDCTTTAYDDPWDVASNSPYGPPGMPMADSLWVLGVFDDSDYRQVETGINQSIRLEPLTSGNGTRGFWFDTDRYRFHVEYRTAEGLDSWIDDGSWTGPDGTMTDPGGGVIVHRQPLTDGVYDRQLIDFHPDGNDDSVGRHPGLEAGESYTSPDNLFGLSVTTADSNGATIALTFPTLSKVARWSGSDRYEASAKISSKTFKPGVTTAYIASGELYADALSGASVAGMHGGPILLVSKDKIPDAIEAELTRLQPDSIVVFGGPATISDQVLADLSSYTSGSVDRWSGADRFSTSATISTKSYDSGVDTAYLASGRVFTDALSGAPVAGKTDGPVLLTDTNSLPAPIAAELERLAPKKIVVFGGANTITTAVEDQLKEYAPVERVWGPDRFTTSTAITSANYLAPVKTAYIASGHVYTDALSGAPVAGASGNPILLTDQDKLPASIAAELIRMKPNRIVVFGGPATISYDVQAALAGYLVK